MLIVKQDVSREPLPARGSSPLVYPNIKSPNTPYKEGEAREDAHAKERYIQHHENNEFAKFPHGPTLPYLPKLCKQVVHTLPKPNYTLTNSLH